MTRFNLSDRALKHRSFIWFLMIIALIAAGMTDVSIRRQEGPEFSIKTMIIAAALPGADTQETLTQVTDRIEKQLGDLNALDFTRSVTRPGGAIIYVELLPSTKPAELPAIWQRVRNMMNDIRPDFPKEFGGFQFNASFGDVFGNTYAFTSDGFSPRETRDHVEQVRQAVQVLDDAGKVEIFGTRDAVIYLEYSTDRLAALGLNRQAVQATLAAQNAIIPSGVTDAGPERVLVRVSGQFSDTDSLEDINLRVGDRFFRLTDVADIRRGYQDPPSDLFRDNGPEAIGLSIGMRAGANIVDFDAELTAVMARAQADLPIGLQIHQVADQPAVVDWNEPARVITVNILQDQARQLGITASDIAVASSAINVTALRGDTCLIDIIARGDAAAWQSVGALSNLQISTTFRGDHCAARCGHV